MRIGYLHCFSGISGDMFLGALIDAGVPFEFLRETAEALNLGAELRMERVDRSGLSAIKMHVLEAAHRHTSGDEVSHQEAGHSHSHGHDHSHSHAHQPSPGSPHEHSPTEQTEHVHGRFLPEIRTLIERAALEPEVKQSAIHAFELLGASEAKMHNVPIEQVHFHEVGAVDAIIDIVCGCAGAHSLGIDQWVCSPLNVGSGMVRCAHGVFPVPAPATLDLLQGAPIYAEGPEGERVTPTGAALIRALGCSFGPMPSMLALASGYGAGSRNPKDYPNVLRLTFGDSEARHSQHVQGQLLRSDATGDEETIAVLETAIDDSTPQVIGFLMEAAFAAGAYDVMTTPVLMKKNRPGVLVTILCDPADTARFSELLFRQTSTIGVRTRLEHRQCLQREIVTVTTEWGEVRLKIARLHGVVVNSAPEYEDCRRWALLHKVPLKEIQSAAAAEYARRTQDGVREKLESGVSLRS